MKEQFLVFDWQGLIGHFRKLDTNSSSLSYSFPPPTAISGMLAGVCGMERDQYYSIFSPDNIQFAVQIRQRTRKFMQTVNYMFVKSKNDLNMSASTPHTQIPVELLVADKFPKKFLKFRIFLKIKEPALFETLSTYLTRNKQKHIPYLGSAPFQSWLHNCAIKNVAVCDDSLNVQSVVPTKSFKNARNFFLDNKNPSALYFEHMRRFFREGREPGDMIDLVWDGNNGGIASDFSSTVYRFEFNDESTNVIFF
ncbi:MAG TPA: CRISPR-associated protein Cas5 [bacterium]|nr:CRISPR-associated protein Cas5 [bacterium]HNT67283.1 CRISPR-associated protein Cas5 [bacterium]HOX86226.1 CRISPR-associated protein Cas5 [bacterium]HPG45560.1 CRISPR-associated protein Cas5 [bacterium]HPM97661.1 CRISPR-associated protein Cas5 [bacterium]